MRNRNRINNPLFIKLKFLTKKIKLSQKNSLLNIFRPNYKNPLISKHPQALILYLLIKAEKSKQVFKLNVTVLPKQIKIKLEKFHLIKSKNKKFKLKSTKQLQSKILLCLRFLAKEGLELCI